MAKRGIEFDAVVADETQIEQFRLDGHTAFPVVVVTREDSTYCWSDLRLDEIEALAK